MRLYVALSLLEEDEWSRGTTACAACADPLELFLRKCLRGEQSTEEGLFAGHVSLYFEDADDSMVLQNQLYAQPDAVRAKSFSIDILKRNRHAVNVVQSGACGWYGRWHNAIVKLYEVPGLSNDDIRRVHAESIALMTHDYTSVPNVVALMPCIPWNPYCCCCCSYFASRINCVGAVELALERGLRRPLNVARRCTAGARLPSELVKQLERVGEVQYAREIVLLNTKNDRERPCVTNSAALPLLTLRDGENR